MSENLMAGCRCWCCGRPQRMAGANGEPANLLYYQSALKEYECEECTRDLADKRATPEVSDDDR